MNVDDKHAAFLNDWGNVAPGTRVLFSELLIPQRSLNKWAPRKDGLYELVFMRMKKMQGHETPLFCSPDDKKLTCHGGAYFAIADDQSHVNSLLKFIQSKQAEQDAIEQQRKEQRELEAAERKKRLEADRARRNALIEEAAKKAGISVEEMKDACERWDSLRNKAFRPNTCFMCFRVLTDPASIVSGIGPECIKKVPALKAALTAKLVDIGRLRLRSEQIIQRLTKAGYSDMAEVLERETRK